ncbi:MAG: polysaccharide deacetylase family protein [Gammaproteobacteria bacterium]
MPGSRQSTVEAWAMLQQELDLWVESGKTAAFWWRDDDAAEETPQLHALDALSREMKIPVSVAVIPKRLHRSLPQFLHTRDHFIAMQHGYSHSSYAVRGAKKIELGGNRSTDEIQTELTTGREQLGTAFGKQFIPVLVPPWNRIEPRVYSALANAGFSGISTMWTRESAYPFKGLLQVNTHLDPVDWRHDRGFIGEASAIEQIHRHLSARRLEDGDIAEPSGILTHHLSQNDEVWAFCRTLFEMLNRHPAVRWLNAREIWRAESK